MYDPEKPFSKNVLDSISQTWKGHVVLVNDYPIIKTPLGFFIEHVDGVGTKALLHWNQKSYASAAIDAFAMNANDLCILGFKPLTLNCHLLISQEREEAILGVVNTLSEYFPNLKRIIVGRQVLTPPDIERITGLTQGNIFQGELGLSQLFFLRPAHGLAQYRTPIRGYYQCGSATHPGGGISGAPGYLAAQKILKDWKR